MNIDEVARQLKEQRSRLNAAIQALEGTKRRGWPPGSNRRTMSAAARKRISQAMKARWAATKKAQIWATGYVDWIRAKARNYPETSFEVED